MELGADLCSSRLTTITSTYFSFDVCILRKQCLCYQFLNGSLISDEVDSLRNVIDVLKVLTFRIVFEFPLPKLLSLNSVDIHAQNRIP